MSRSKTRLQPVVDEIEKLGAQGFAVAGDLTKGSDCQQAVKEAVSILSLRLVKASSCVSGNLLRLNSVQFLQVSLMGGLDILVNNGARFSGYPLLTIMHIVQCYKQRSSAGVLTVILRCRILL